MQGHECSICATTKFKRYGTRRFGKCTGCGALERTRVIFSIFKKLDLLKPDKKILHIAPEGSLVEPFFAAFGANYTVADLRKEALEHLDPGIEKVVLDMTAISPEMEKRRFDIILHSHILEHLRGSWPLALLRLDGLINPDGHHVFALPIMKEWSSEDLGPMSTPRRIRAFGQHDHMRYIGRRDFRIDMKSVRKLANPEYLRGSSDILSKEEMAAIEGDKDVFVMKKRPAKPVSKVRKILDKIAG